MRFVSFDDASKAVVSLRREDPDDLHPPAPDAVTRRAQHLGPAAAGHRLRRLDHVTRQRDYQVGAVNPGQRPMPGKSANGPGSTINSSSMKLSASGWSQ